MVEGFTKRGGFNNNSVVICLINFIEYQYSDLVVCEYTIILKLIELECTVNIRETRPVGFREYRNLRPKWSGFANGRVSRIFPEISNEIFVYFNVIKKHY